MRSTPNLESLPAIKGTGWGFHDPDGVGELEPTAREQVKLLTLRALHKSKMPDGHVLTGIERINARECRVEVLFVAAPPNLSLPLSAVRPEGLLELVIPSRGFMPDEFASVCRAHGLEPIGARRRAS